MTKMSGFNLRIERGSEFVTTQWESDARSVYYGLERVISTSVRSYGLVSILNAFLIFFIAFYPILFVVIYTAFHATSYVLFVGCIVSILNIVFFFVLVEFETHNTSRKLPLSAFLYLLGGLPFSFQQS